MTRTALAARRIVFAVLLAALALCFLLPYLWMLGSAFKPRSELFSNVLPVSWKTFIPLSPTLANFNKLLFEMGFARNILNTLLLSTLTVTGSILLCSMSGYVFAMVEFRGSGLLFFLIVFTMMVPFEARMIPTFLVVQGLRLSDSFPALFLPWFADAFLIMLFRNHFSGIPRDLYNAAVIDGCPHWKIFWLIMLPNVTPALISGGLIKFFFAWDSYVWPLIVLRSPKWQVIGVAIANLFTDQSVAWELIFAGSGALDHTRHDPLFPPATFLRGRHAVGRGEGVMDMDGRPNILFIMTDQMRADALGCSGGLPASTPNLDRLARRGTLFTRCADHLSHLRTRPSLAPVGTLSPPAGGLGQQPPYLPEGKTELGQATPRLWLPHQRHRQDPLLPLQRIGPRHARRRALYQGLGLPGRRRNTGPPSERHSSEPHDGRLEGSGTHGKGARGSRLPLLGKSGPRQRERPPPGMVSGRLRRTEGN